MSGVGDMAVYSLFAQADGKVVVGGTFTSVNGTQRRYLARLNGDGSLDSSFASGLTLVNDWIGKVALQSDAKILLTGGFTSVNGVSRNRIARLNSDGTLDTEFANGVSGLNSWAQEIVIQSDGKIILAGDFTSVNGVTRNRIARLNADGTLDTTFGAGLSLANDLVLALAVQADGKIIITGSFTTFNDVARPYIARLNADGSLDTSFAASLSGPDNYAQAVVVQSDGKIVIGGAFSAFGSVSRGRIARLNDDGSLDTTFGNGLAGANSGVYAITAQPNGRVLLGGGFLTINGTQRAGFARLNTDGTLDTSFTTALAGGSIRVRQAVVQTDGRILIGGEFTSVDGVARGRVARLYGAPLSP